MMGASLNPPLFLPWCAHHSGIWTHQTTWSSARVQSLCSLGNWSPPQLVSLLSGFLKVTQLFSPNPLSSLCIVRVEMLLLSLLNKAVSSTVVFFTIWFPKMFKWSPTKIIGRRSLVTDHIVAEVISWFHQPDREHQQYKRAGGCLPGGTRFPRQRLHFCLVILAFHLCSLHSIPSYMINTPTLTWLKPLTYTPHICATFGCVTLYKLINFSIGFALRLSRFCHLLRAGSWQKEMRSYSLYQLGLNNLLPAEI